MTMRLNCDLGESFGSWNMGLDSAVMPYIDQANIACGFHAGDPLVMSRTLALAKMPPAKWTSWSDHLVTGRCLLLFE